MQTKKHTVIHENLILGGTNDLNKDFIDDNNIGYNICCAEECENFYCEKNKFVKSQKIFICDSWNTEMTSKNLGNRVKTDKNENETQIETFEKAFEIINEAKENKKTCFVHCMRGRSRSTSVIILYLMKIDDLDLKTAYIKIKKLRPFIGPHRMLMEQLINIEKIIFKKNSINDVSEFKRLESEIESNSTSSNEKEEILESKKIEIIENKENEKKFFNK
jgi:hypothetical protein